MDLDAIRNIIGIIGNVISFGLFMSPAPTFFTIIKKGDVEEFSPNPYMATILNCAMWVFYGMPFVHPNSVLVVTINGFGLCLEIIYISIYLKYAGDKKKRMYVIRMLAGELVFFIIVAAVTLAFFHTTERRSMIVGTIAVVFNILMYGMPLDVMLMVIKTKSAEYLPFYLLLANFLNGSVWLAYAQIHFDLYLTISNGSGLLLGLAQLTLYACYYKSTPKRGDTKNGVQLSSYDNEKGVV